MSDPYRRYEIHLPQRFNDAQMVPEELVAETLVEAKQQFEAGGKVYCDRRGRVFVDVLDTPESRQFFADFKERLKTRFEQLDIWMTSHPINVI